MGGSRDSATANSARRSRRLVGSRPAARPGLAGLLRLLGRGRFLAFLPLRQESLLGLAPHALQLGTLFEREHARDVRVHPLGHTGDIRDVLLPQPLQVFTGAAEDLAQLLPLFGRRRKPPDELIHQLNRDGIRSERRDGRGRGRIRARLGRWRKMTLGPACSPRGQVEPPRRHADREHSAEYRPRDENPEKGEDDFPGNVHPQSARPSTIATASSVGASSGSSYAAMPGAAAAGTGASAS